MRKIFLILAFCATLFSSEVNSDKNEAATKEDIKIILDRMDKKFEQVDKRFEQIDKRLEQVDRRFEQVEKRIDFAQNILYIILTGVIATPFLAQYLTARKDEEYRKDHERMTQIIFALKI